MQKNKKCAKNIKNSKQASQIENFKKKYFDFYDDVKDYTNGKEDW